MLLKIDGDLFSNHLGSVPLLASWIRSKPQASSRYDLDLGCVTFFRMDTRGLDRCNDLGLLANKAKTNGAAQLGFIARAILDIGCGAQELPCNGT